MLSDHLKAYPDCRNAWHYKVSRERNGLTKAASGCYQGKLKELAAIIKGTARPLSEHELEKQYSLSQSQPKTKGASLINPVARAEGEVKLEMLAKMVRGV